MANHAARFGGYQSFRGLSEANQPPAAAGGLLASARSFRGGNNRPKQSLVCLLFSPIFGARSGFADESVREKLSPMNGAGAEDALIIVPGIPIPPLKERAEEAQAP